MRSQLTNIFFFLGGGGSQNNNIFKELELNVTDNGIRFKNFRVPAIYLKYTQIIKL